jgi:diguanylate cyclase (GGDEF)-like protein/PAS domain S-box-containing protein
MAARVWKIGEKPRFALAMQASLDGLFELDLRTNEACFSPQWQNIAGQDPSTYVADLNHWLDRVHPEDRAHLIDELRALQLGKARQIRNEHRLLGATGAWRRVQVRAIPERNDQGAVVGIAGAISDHTEWKMIDPLTGLPNRLHFIDHLQRRFAHAQQHGDWDFAVLSIGLDRFKIANESLGYTGGDALLSETASRLSETVARHPGQNDTMIARLNGAEFLVCLEAAANEEAAIEVAEEIGSVLSRPFQWLSNRVTPAIVIGLAHADPSIGQSEGLMRDADSALVEAKTGERGRLVCYSSGMRERAIARIQMEVDLEYAIRAGQLVLHYQPEIDLATRRIIGFEALIRWQHPQRGLVMPNEFIPLAEETGLILPLGDWGLMEACRQIMAWRELILQRSEDALEMMLTQSLPIDLRVSVNLSAKQFGRPGLVKQIAGILSSTAIAAADLRLEVTETSLMNHEDTAQATMQDLQKLGVGLHMDDFGTGYSSLNHLHRYPFDTLKIDRTFVKAMTEQKSSAEIVRAILDLGHSLNMEVVAEGIETAEQAARLRSLGCRLGQGYYFARPMAPEAISAMFERQQLPDAALAASASGVHRRM